MCKREVRIGEKRVRKVLLEYIYTYIERERGVGLGRKGRKTEAD